VKSLSYNCRLRPTCTLKTRLRRTGYRPRRRSAVLSLGRPWLRQTALKRALEVGVESTATSFDKRALVGAPDKVAEAFLSLVREAKAIDGVLGGRATASHQAAS